MFTLLRDGDQTQLDTLLEVMRHGAHADGRYTTKASRKS